MIVIDVAEKPYVFQAFDKLKIPYIKEELVVPESCNKVPLREDGMLICIESDMLQYLDTFEKDDLACVQCPKSPHRVGDFTNETRSFIAERKRVDDYYASMADGRLYEQARKMYSYCNGLKILILEGMANHTYFQDGNNPFGEFDKSIHDLKTKSPIEQLLLMHPDKIDWIWGTIKDLASCEVALVQSWSLEETVRIVQTISCGAGEEPKIRAVPKKISGLTLEETMLTVIPRIGKKRAQELIKEYGSMGKLITAIREMPQEEAEKKSITKILKEILDDGSLPDL